ncbi:MAG: type II toxin-antitoxin system VapC family toxin [Propionibacteriaceae bacterium]|nr:type II toxin-antitoxin system VapC family toxin [Propionibacteriaceae bacterium]
MRVTVDTNVLLRTIVADDPDQARLAAALLDKADAIVVCLPVLTELVWVLRRSYAVSRADVADTIRTLCQTEKVSVDQAAVNAGLVCLEAGGDFADGVIAHQGAWLGGEVFVSFDVKAVKALTATGVTAQLLV